MQSPEEKERRILSEDVDGYQIYTDSQANIYATTHSSTNDKALARGTWLLEHYWEIKFTASSLRLYFRYRNPSDQKQELMSFRFTLDAQYAANALNEYLGEIAIHRFRSILNDIVTQEKEHNVFLEGRLGGRIYADLEGNVFTKNVEEPPEKILTGGWIRQMGPLIQFETKAQGTGLEVRLCMANGDHIPMIKTNFQREADEVIQALNRHVQKMAEGEGEKQAGEKRYCNF